MNIKYFILSLLFSVISMSSIANAKASNAIGQISLVLNDVTVMHHGKPDTAPLQKGDLVYLGDVITTQTEDSFVRVDFIDETHITMNGEDGELTIDEYIFDPANLNHNKAKFTVLRSSFEFVGGLIDKGETENTQIDLDFGSIGVRGTKILRSMKDGECWIYLQDGEIRVFNDGGEVFLKPNDGTRMGSKTKAPTPSKPWGQKNIDWIKSEVAVPAQ